MTALKGDLRGLPLARRELECLLAYSRHGDQAAVAAELGVSRQTVKNLLGRAYQRLGVTGAIEAFNALGWITTPTFDALGALPDEPASFASWLRRAMHQRKLSGRRLAELSGLDHSAVVRIRQERRQPYLETAIRLVRALVDHPGALGAGADQRATSVRTSGMSMSMSAPSAP